MTTSVKLTLYVAGLGGQWREVRSIPNNPGLEYFGVVGANPHPLLLSAEVLAGANDSPNHQTAEESKALFRDYLARMEVLRLRHFPTP